MLGYYTAVMALSCMALMVLTILVYENGRLKRAMKRRLYEAYALMIIATLAEWAGVALNGAPEWTTGIHILVKCLDYIVTPIAGVFFARQVSEDNGSKARKILVIILAANAVLEIMSAFTGWTFYIDADNVYHHGPYYFIYAIVYCIIIVCVLLEFRIYGKNFKKKNQVSLYSIVLLTCTGIALQEIIGSPIRTSCLAFVLGSIFLFIHYSEFQQQINDEKLLHQKRLVETDALTGLLSRYAYIETLKEYQNNEKLPLDLVCFSMDINGLKTVNDTMGHEAGDELICGAAKCISKVLGKYGKCFRTGGDEFIAILRMERVQIKDARKSLRQAVANWQGEIVKKLSISVGYAAVEDYRKLPIEEIINISDKMMYKDKRRYGRDRFRDSQKR